MAHLQTLVHWKPNDDPEHPYIADVAGHAWMIRMNDFPEDPYVYTLLVDGDAVESFNEWPSASWRKPDEPDTVAEPQRPRNSAEEEARLEALRKKHAIDPAVAARVLTEYQGQERKERELLGAAHAPAILDPWQRLAASERLAASVPTDDGASLPADRRSAGHDAMRRAAGGIVDLLKLIPAGADEVPMAAAESEADKLRRACFRRDRLEARLWEYRVAAARLKPAREPPSPPTKASGIRSKVINRAVGDAHRAWLLRGRTGDGRLCAQDANLEGAPIGAANLTAARFVGCNLSYAAMPYAKLKELELIDCLLYEARLDQTQFEDALIQNCIFKNTDLRLALLFRCRIQRASMQGAKLDRCRFDDGEVEDVSFHGTPVRDATFDRAIVVDCDFRDADLSLCESRLKLCSMRDAAFIRCDFRGSKWEGRRVSGTLFEQCTFDGATGKPEILSPNRIVRADVPFLG